MAFSKAHWTRLDSRIHSLIHWLTLSVFCVPARHRVWLTRNHFTRGKHRHGGRLCSAISFFQRAATLYVVSGLTCQRKSLLMLPRISSVFYTSLLLEQLNKVFCGKVFLFKKMLMGHKIWLYHNLPYLAIIKNLCTLHKFHVRSTIGLNVVIYKFWL